MQIQNGEGSLSNEKVIITHNGVSSVWETSPFEKTSFSQEFDDFEQINGYWSFLPAASQDAIFEIYQRIRSIFNEVHDVKQLAKELKGTVAELFRYHSQEDVHHWATFHADLRIPDSVKAVPPAELPRVRTYLVEDYRQLVTLAISFRIIIPVWGEYISRTRKEHGSTFKEMFAARLLNESNVVHSPAWLRLVDFVTASIPTDKSIDSAIYDSVGSYNFPEWVRALVVVRKLCVGDVRGVDPFSNLPAVIYKYLLNKVKGMDSNFSGVVKDKPKADDRQDSENNISVAETYKVKEAVSAGDVVIQAFYTEDVQRMALVVEPNLDLKVLEQSIKSVKAMNSEQIHECQTVLMQWVMAPAISPRGLLRLNKESVLRVMAATQAILWHRGHLEIAALVSAVALRGDLDHDVTGGDKIPRLRPEQVETLNRLYPHYRRQGGRSKQTRQPNAAITALENVNEMFNEHVWQLTIPKEWLGRVNGTSGRLYGPPADLKQKLAELIIAIAS